MNRRKFLTWVGIGGIASYLPLAMAACTPQSTDTSSDTDNPPEDSTPTETTKLDSTPREDGFIALSTIDKLNEEGQIVKKTNDVIVIRDPQTSELIALKSLCTHQGCTVKWDGESNNLVCPCHGSAFGKDGAVITGPATKPLDIYEVKEEEGVVLVKTT